MPYTKPAWRGSSSIEQPAPNKSTEEKIHVLYFEALYSNLSILSLPAYHSLFNCIMSMSLSVFKKSLKQKRKSFTVKFKAQLVKEYLEGKWSSPKSFMNAYNNKQENEDNHLSLRTFEKWIADGNIEERARNLYALSASDDRLLKRRKGLYSSIETRVIEYIDIANQRLSHVGLGLTQAIMQKRALQFAKDELDEEQFQDFKASNGWFHRLCKRHNIKSIVLHGEGNEIPEEERIKMMGTMKAEVMQHMEEHDIKLENVFNADQTGLFYRKFPNRMYVSNNSNHDKKDSREQRGTKAMKDKDRITVMVATSATGTKLPLAFVGKSKTPKCFALRRAGGRKFFYTHQKKAWFDQQITKWWFVEVFIPWYINHHGTKNHCILMLDNCPAHNDIVNVLKEDYPWLHIVFYPPNLTSRHQPMDQGIIAILKICYRSAILSALLDIYDDPVSAAAVPANIKAAGLGKAGLAEGAKPHVLDAIELCIKIWEEKLDSDALQRCWRKADCLPAPTQAILEQAGSSFRPSSPVDKAVLDELCSVMVRAVKIADTLPQIPTAFTGSFVEEEANRRMEDKPVDIEQIKTMAKSWSGVEDMEEVKNAEIEEALEEIDKQLLLSSEETVAEEIMDEDDDHGHGEVAEARTKIIPTDQDVLKAIQTIQMYGCAKNSNVLQAAARQLRTEYLTIRQRTSVQQATLTNYFFNVPVTNRESAAAAQLMTAATSDDDSKSI